jgi:muconolactone delta-isomerase
MEDAFRKELAAEEETLARELQQAGWLQRLFRR